MNNEQLIAAWNNNEPVKVVEMGGLGTDYEQAIYVMAFTFLTALLALPEPINWKKSIEWRTAIEKQPKIDALITKIGPSGAMVNAAWNVAGVFARQGYEAGMAQAPDRHIFVCKNVPRSYE